MHWGSAWAISHHAGVNPLCICCCDDGNPGGEQFSGTTAELPRRRSNPFVQFRRDTVSRTDTVDASSQVLQNAVNAVNAVNGVDERFQRQLTGPARGNTLARGTPRAPENAQPGPSIATGIETLDDDWFLLVIASDDDS